MEDYVVSKGNSIGCEMSRVEMRMRKILHPKEENYKHILTSSQSFRPMRKGRKREGAPSLLNKKNILYAFIYLN